MANKNNDRVTNWLFQVYWAKVLEKHEGIRLGLGLTNDQPGLLCETLHVNVSLGRK